MSWSCAIVWRRLAASLAVIAGLTGCAAPAVQRHAQDKLLERYILEARFGLRDGREAGTAFQGRVQWQHSVDGDRVMVRDPLGGGVAELTAHPAGARLVMANGDVNEASDAPGLMQALTGVPLPVRSIARWLTGRNLSEPGREGAARVLRDALGRPVSFESEGWKIEYGYEGDAPSDADLLPSRVFARNDSGIELRMAIEEWQLDRVPASPL